jgi:two-component system chemotaxis sensor kinase CheA
VRPPSLAPKRSERPAADKGSPDAGGSEISLRSLANVVRVDIRKLDHLMNVVGELGTVRAALGRLLDRFRSGMDPALASEAQRISRAFARHLADAQESVLDIRMVPLSQLFDKVAVVVRQLAREQDKEVRLLVTGSETEVDKLIAEELADPLMHIVRNAIDHGIEAAVNRPALKKPRTATLAINAYQKGSSVVIELSDDGRGIDPSVVRDAAMKKGLMAESALADFSRDDLLDLVFLPGFSTAAAITDVSGRGVGMDVVKTNITRLGGAVELDSELGVGTKVTITLPITLAIINALLFEVGKRSFALPLTVVQEALRLDKSHVKTIEGREVLTLRGTTLPLCRVSEHFRFARTEGEMGDAFVIVVAVGPRRLGLIVDRLLGQQDLVVKGLGRSLANVHGIAGAADMGDHKLLLVLDAAAILEEVLVGRAPQLGVGGLQ